MREESEEARLMGNHTKNSSMSYTDGPRTPLAESAYPAAAAPPPYEKSMVGGGVNCHGDRTWRKSPTGEEEKIVDQETLKDLMHYSGTTLMTQFHADAMKQVGFGKYQLLMIFIAGLALAAQTVHMCSLFFVFPSLELEFCMTSEQKDMLVAINFVGAAFGAANMGAIAEINGRKRTLLTCMICMTLFSIVSAFMPTFGPFAMARFCAGACAGGVFPIAATYIGEMCPGHMRGRAMSMFVAIGLVGGTVAALVSVFVLPISGEELMLEQRRHFRAWHSYLLVMCLPAIVPIIGLLNLPESPRWLLDVGREVEALEIYQKSYCANRTNGRCTLTELELPGMRSERHSTPKSVLTIMTNNAYQFFESFTSLFRQPYKKVTIALLFAWFGAIFIAYGLAVYVLRFGRSVEEVRFNAKTETTFNSTFENVSFTMNLVNKHFVGANFLNCTFEQMLLSYVQFINCTFLDTNFHGVKTGNTTFTNSFLNNVKFIDTDLDEDDFINCSKNNTEFDRMSGGCDRQFDFNIFNRVGCNAIVGCITPTVLLLMISAETINHFGRVRTATFCITLATILCCMIGFLCLGDVIYWVVGVIQALIITGLVALTIFSTEYYCTYLRCTALGVFVAFSFIGALVGIRVYSGFPVGDTHIAAVMSIAGLSLPTMLTTFLRETSQLL